MGTLNIYIAMDISESIEEEDIMNAKKAVTTLIKKVSNKQLSSWLKRGEKWLITLETKNTG